jgi:polyhydroxybutyrate depolymerase
VPAVIARPVRRASVTAGFAALAVAACGGQAANSSAGSDPPTVSRAADTTAVQAQQASCTSAGLHDVQGGILRMPSGATPGQTPLLLVVIPGGQGDRGDRLGIGRAANRQGFAILYPTAPPDSAFWQLNDQFGTSDVSDVTGLIQRQVATGCFDTNRISITGVSNGAGFTARMGCELPTTFAAVMPVAAGYKALDPCPATARASFLDIHGTADTVVPINGKKPDRKGNVARYTSTWAQRDGCSASRTTRPRALVTRVTYSGCDGGTRVERVALSGTDHGWPRTNTTGRLPSRNPSKFDATTEVMRFVRTARRPGA